ncbi:MAG: SixA phosphatase family protein [Chlamydiota bacterium]
MTTTLVLLRHGKPDSEGYADDALRPLSEEGRDVQRKMMAMLQRMGYAPTSVYTSPLLRAQQTAEVVEEIFGVEAQDEEALSNDFDASLLLQKLPPPDDDATIFFVGHAPNLGDFANSLAGKEFLTEGLSKSSFAIIEFKDKVAFGCGHFVGYQRPTKG